MSVTVTASTVHDAIHELGGHRRVGAIIIEWRKGPYDVSSYLDNHAPGCIVDATAINGEEVKRAFPTSRAAVRYIASLLKKHDADAREQAKTAAKAERARRAKSKAK